MDDMKPITISNVQGKTISKVFDCDHAWKEHRTKTQVPGPEFMPSFDLKFGRRTILILDNYGNDYMPEEIEERLFGDEFSHQWLLGIDRASGELLSFRFYHSGKSVVAAFSQLPGAPKVPKKYLTKENLQYIRGCKRPWMCTWNHYDWLAFWNRDLTWDDFAASMVINLSLIPSTWESHHVEVWGERHRTVTTWD